MNLALDRGLSLLEHLSRHPDGLPLALMAEELDIPLSFLGSGAYNADVYADAPDAATQPKNTVRDRRSVNSTSVLHVKLAPGGGAAIRITPAR